MAQREKLVHLAVRKRVFIRGSGNLPSHFFEGLTRCVTGSRSYQAFSCFSVRARRRTKNIVAKKQRISFLFKYAISECLRTKMARNWLRLMYISLFVLARSQNMNFFHPCRQLHPFVPAYPINASAKKQISRFCLKRSRIQISASLWINCNSIARKKICTLVQVSLVLDITWKIRM